MPWCGPEISSYRRLLHDSGLIEIGNEEQFL